MPGYKTHLLGGCGAFLATVLILQIPLELGWSVDSGTYLGLSLLGSIFPDIDVASKMQRLFLIVATPGMLILLLTNRHSAFFAISGLVLFVLMLRHRTLTHQVSFLVAMPLLVTAVLVYSYQLCSHFAFNSAFFFIAGCLSHVLLDRTQTKLKRLVTK